uniref:Uncharacterized protein n=1 Tax=Romanomermis culicivorax TaxID=13658 RepID=A0A915IIB0_ROMCU
FFAKNTDLVKKETVDYYRANFSQEESLDFFRISSDQSRTHHKRSQTELVTNGLFDGFLGGAGAVPRLANVGSVGEGREG